MNDPSPTLDPLSVAHRLYEAFRRGDGAALFALLHPDFTGYVSDGMPMAVGGAVPDRQHMLRVWGTIAAEYAVRPIPGEFIRADASRIVVLGHYCGSGLRKGGGGPIRAVFAHILDIRDNAIVSLKQITDTASWSV
ncbi:nuclear transport factor 2 family protein [Pendulispora rubella]|uniref:Nuclear transport factor 2 family protein n=1 Tax=Pendulispora rubella TaxID=2741070 RepID=A0ABZ2L8B4_9BACT